MSVSKSELGRGWGRSPASAPVVPLRGPQPPWAVTQVWVRFGSGPQEGIGWALLSLAAPGRSLISHRWALLSRLFVLGPVPGVRQLTWGRGGGQVSPPSAQPCGCGSRGLGNGGFTTAP